MSSTSSSRKLVPTPKVCHRYGDVSPSTVWRWEHDPEMNFPKPVRIKGRKYWRESELDAHDNALLAAGAGSSRT
jgi:predicted DNA-binding transcriptional regulator AlpA